MRRVLLPILCATAVCMAYRDGRVHPRDIEVITLRAGSYTKGRRSLRIPQLLAVEAPPDVAWRPDSVKCTNVGWDGRNVQWRCETHDMPTDLKFGRMDVSCEGYESPDDEYVLEGSCGLEYELLRNRPPPPTSPTHESSPPPFTHKDAAALCLVTVSVAVAITFCTCVCWVAELCRNSSRQVVTPTDVYEDASPVYHTGPPHIVYARSPPVVVALPPVAYASAPPANVPARPSTGGASTRKATGFAFTKRR